MSNTANGGFYNPNINEFDNQQNSANARKAPKMSRRNIPRQLVEPVDQDGGGYHNQDNDTQQMYENEFNSIPGPSRGMNFNSNSNGRNMTASSSRARFGAKNSPMTESADQMRRNLSPRFDMNRL